MNLYSTSSNFPQGTSLRRRVRRPRRAKVLAARRAALGVLGRGPERCVRQIGAGTWARTSQITQVLWRLSTVFLDSGDLMGYREIHNQYDVWICLGYVWVMSEHGVWGTLRAQIWKNAGDVDQQHLRQGREHYQCQNAIADQFPILVLVVVVVVVVVGQISQIPSFAHFYRLT